MERANCVGPSPRKPLEKENPPGVPDGFIKECAPRANSACGELPDTLRRILQARRAVRRLLELDITIADEEALPLGREHLVDLYRECWGVLEASAAIFEAEFAEIFGVSLKKFSFAMSAVGWELLTPDQRRRLTRGEKALDWFISPSELGQ